MMTLAELQQALARGPYHQWLRLTATAFAEDTVEIRAQWREEWVANPDHQHTHGGVLAALVDVAAHWALVSRTGRPVPTVDMRVDYHRPAMPGDLIARGTVIKFGRQLSVCDAQVLGLDGKLRASGRGTFYTGTRD
ncbi:MAG: phenylacetic acid degradation protein [Ramlibacter sp.]|jgi:uncharacterized protein (TIGR00369 family)|nr:phenylacetic acid degradation protein [Ramlibacter sp.]